MNAPILLFPGSRRSGAQPRSQPESSYPLVADVSNYSGRITDAQVEAMIAAGVAGVIVRVDTADPERIAIMQQQLAVLRSHGVSVGGYLFVDFNEMPTDELDRIWRLAGPLRSLWIDWETVGGSLPATFAILRWWLQQAALVMPAITTLGLYTSAYQISQTPAWRPLRGADGQLLPLWLADYTYSRPMNLDVMAGGWTQASAIQFSDKGNIAGVNCDLSVFRSDLV